MDTKVATASGIGFLPTLGFILVLLKVTGVVSWSWAIVLLPFLVSIFLGIVTIIGAMCFWAVATFFLTIFMR